MQSALDRKEEPAGVILTPHDFPDLAAAMAENAFLKMISLCKESRLIEVQWRIPGDLARIKTTTNQRLKSENYT
jgi:hypothetical protein